MPKRSSKRKRRSKALPALGFAGVSLSMASGACASTEASADTPPPSQGNELFLGEEETALVECMWAALAGMAVVPADAEASSSGAALAAAAAGAVGAAVAAAVLAGYGPQLGAGSIAAGVSLRLGLRSALSRPSNPHRQWNLSRKLTGISTPPELNSVLHCRPVKFCATVPAASQSSPRCAAPHPC